MAQFWTPDNKIHKPAKKPKKFKFGLNSIFSKKSQLAKKPEKIKKSSKTQKIFKKEKNTKITKNVQNAQSYQKRQKVFKSRFFSQNRPIRQKNIKYKAKAKFRKSLKFLKFATILIVLGAIALTIYAFLPNVAYFKVKDINVIGAQTYVSARDLEQIAIASTKDVYVPTLNTAELESKLLNNFQGATQIKVVKKLPNKLEIQVTEREPLAVLNTPNLVDPELGSSYLIDKEGYVLGIYKNTESKYTNISYNEQIAVGDFVDADLIPLYFQLLNLLEDENIKVDSLNINPRSISLKINDKIQVTLPKDQDQRYNVQTLSQLLKMLQSDSKNPRSIDLRYDKVVVTYEEGSDNTDPTN